MIFDCFSAAAAVGGGGDLDVPPSPISTSSGMGVANRFPMSLVGGGLRWALVPYQALASLMTFYCCVAPHLILNDPGVNPTSVFPIDRLFPKRTRPDEPACIDVLKQKCQDFLETQQVRIFLVCIFIIR